MVIQRHHFDYINITALLKITFTNNCDSWKDQHLRGMLQRSLIMGSFLSDTNPTLSEYYNLNRAIYWMEFAVNNGNIDAKSKLQELKKLKRMDRRKNKENP